MKRAEILKEIESFDITSCSDGLTFCEVFASTKKLTPIEELLFYCNCPKYYYNYSEKRLRKLEVNIASIINFEDKQDIIFVCRDLEDEPEIEIAARQFSDKVICHQDSHKVITYDNETKHYECFFVNLTDKKIKAFYKEAKEKLPPGWAELMFDESTLGDDEDAKSTKEAVMEELADAFDSICHYLYDSNEEISEIKFYNVPEGVQVDLVTSKLWKPGESLGV